MTPAETPQATIESVPMPVTPPVPKLRGPRPVPPYDPTSYVVTPRYVDRVTGVSEITAWRLRKIGQFPSPVRVSPGRVAYLRSDLENWVKARQSAK